MQSWFLGLLAPCSSSLFTLIVLYSHKTKARSFNYSMTRRLGRSVVNKGAYSGLVPRPPSTPPSRIQAMG